MDPEVEKCFLLLNQTLALADYLSLKIVVGIEISDKRCWSTNDCRLQDDLLAEKLSFRENDVWLETGKVFAQGILGKNDLLTLREMDLAKKESSFDTGSFEMPEINGSVNDNGIDGLDDEKSFSAYSLSQHGHSLNDETSEANFNIKRENDSDETGEKFVLKECEKCHLTFASLNEMVEHFRDIHTQCFQCGKGFTRVRSVNEHVQRVHLKIPGYACHLCEEKFRFTSDRTKHLRQIHGVQNLPRTGAKPWTPQSLQCQHCGKTFSRPRSVREHIESTHMMIKRYRCLVCGEKFRFSADRTRHHLLHHNVKIRESDRPKVVPKVPRKYTKKDLRDVKVKRPYVKKSKHWDKLEKEETNVTDVEIKVEKVDEEEL